MCEIHTFQAEGFDPIAAGRKTGKSRLRDRNL